MNKQQGQARPPRQIKRVCKSTAIRLSQRTQKTREKKFYQIFVFFVSFVRGFCCNFTHLCPLALALVVNFASPARAQTPQPTLQPIVSPTAGPVIPIKATVVPIATAISLPSATAPVLPSPPNPPTATPQQFNGDAFEPNNTPAEVLAQNPPRSFISAGQVLNGLNFNNGAGVGAAGDVDWVQMYVKGGATYQLTTIVQPGVDTELFIYRDQADEVIATNDDYRPLDRGSQAQFTAQADGRYWAKIWNKDPSPRAAGQSYALELKEILLNTPTAVPSAPLAPTPTLLPSAKAINPNRADKFEYNGDVASATAIELNKTYDFLNFAPFNPSAPDVVDNDFYKLSVMRGSTFSCHTFNLGGGADTNMIVYEQALTEVGRNDDVSDEERNKGNLGSRVTWQAKADGVVYILVFDAYPLPADAAAKHTYALQCYFGAKPPETAPKATPDFEPPPQVKPPQPPTKAPLDQAGQGVSPSAPSVPQPAPNLPPAPNATVAVAAILQNAPLVVPVRPLPRSLPTAVPTPSLPMRSTVLTLQLFSDTNANGIAEPIEGISGVSVRVLDDGTGELLDQALTDRDGNVRFVALSDGAVRVSVPWLTYVQVVNEAAANIRIAFVAQPFLPERLP